LANITALLVLGLIVGLAGIVVAAPAVVTGGADLLASGSGSSSAGHGSCVSTFVHSMQQRLGSSVGIGDFVRVMAHRC